MKEIILINMASDQDMHEWKKDYNPPLGILSIATCLELHGHDCMVIDYCYERKNLLKLVETILEEHVKIVGFSVYTINVDEAIRISRYLKKTLPYIIILFGGPHASLDSEYCSKPNSVDYVIRGEGESSVLELVEAVTSGYSLVIPDQIEGVCYRKKDRKVESEIRSHAKNLDLLPIVKREFVAIEKYKGFINFCTSRGCPANCIYCAGSKLGGQGYRIRNIENVILETAYVKNILGDRFEAVYFIDDTFTAVKKRVLYFIKLRRKFGLLFQWRCESRLDVVDEELLSEISKNGCIAVHFGVESGSQEVLNKIQKKLDLEMAKKKLVFASTTGMTICCYFMLGHYCDTMETMKDTCDLIKELASKYSIDATLHYNTPYPGTYQYQYKDELGIRMTSMNYSDFLGYQPIMETSDFTIHDQLDFYNDVKEYLNLHSFLYE
jgi:anaerobic magnesium-protoporphyrin IX monomethyl ester cyclase